MATIDLPRPQHERAQLDQALVSGPVVVSALPGALAHDLLRECSPTLTVSIDAAAAGSVDGLVVDITRQALRDVTPHFGARSANSSPTGNQLVSIARAYGRRIDDALAAESGAPPKGFTLDDALAGLPTNALLVVDSGHLLVERWADRVLWTMRGRAEDGELRLALIVPAWADERLDGPNEAFFGFAERVEVSNRADGFDWAHALRGKWDIVEVEWAVNRTNGQFAEMSQVVEHASRRGIGLRAAVEEIVDASILRVPRALRTAQALTTLGGRLLRAVALGEQPYPSVPHAAPNRIASALRILQRADLIYSATRGEWRLSDPLLAAAFAAHEGRAPRTG
jgi:hypothetical protein